MRHTILSTRKTARAGLILVLAAAVAFGGSSFASAASKRALASSIVAYEGFCYQPGSAPGDTGSGWSGAWTAPYSLVASPGLTFPNFPTAAAPCASSGSLGPNPGNAATRGLASPVTRSSSGGVILRALIRSNVLGAPETQAILGNAGADTLTIGDLPELTPKAAYWGIQVNGGGERFSGIRVQQGVTTALTVRVDFGAGTGGQDLVRFWVQTTGSYCSPSGSVLTPGCSSTFAGPLSAPAMTSFSGVFWQARDAVVDEISVDRIPLPPPPADATLCGRKFWDRDEDGTRESPFETPLSRWTMNVTGGPSAPFSLTSNGACKNVAAGTYTVTDVPEPGWAASTQTSQTVRVRSLDVETVTFGNRAVCDPALPMKIVTNTPGGVDSFAGPQPADTPLGFGAPSMFDWPNADQPFFQEFRRFPDWHALCQVKLEIRVKPVASSGPDDDSITLSAGDPASSPGVWQQYFGGNGNPVAPGAPLAGPTWTGSAPVLFTWTLDANGGLPPGDAAGDDNPPLMTGKTLFDRFRLPLVPRRPLDITIQDDTSVDYIKLTLTYQ